MIVCSMIKGYMWTLDIVIEGAVFLPVFPKEAEGIVVPKVLKLDQSVLPIFVHHSFHELIDEIIIGLRAISLLIKTHVEWILEEGLIGDKVKYSSYYIVLI